MRKVLTSARRHWRLRSATALAAVGALILTSGVAVLAAPATATQGDQHKVWVCHATSSDSNPYVAIHVDVASVKYQGHLAHRTDPNKKWKEAGTWNSDDHAKNAAKPDLIEGLDGFTGSYPAFCDSVPPPTTLEKPERETTESCELGHGVREGVRYIEFEWVDGDEATGGDGSWEPEPVVDQTIVWGDWHYAAYSAEEYARLCGTRPPTKDPVTVPLTQSQSSCERGFEQRSGSQTTTYTWNARTKVFDASVSAPVWGSWAFVPALTDAEFDALDCRPDQPPPQVVDLADEQMGCDIGVEQRTGTQTTSYVWNAQTREYGAVVVAEVWGDWVKVRNLTTEEVLDLKCIAGEETVVPKPERPKPAVEPGTEPTVAGVQTVAPEASVPTAVASGLSDDLGVSTSQLLGQALAVLGLVMLVAAGWLALSRRAAGAHA